MYANCYKPSDFSQQLLKSGNCLSETTSCFPPTLISLYSRLPPPLHPPFTPAHPPYEPSPSPCPPVTLFLAVCSWTIFPTSVNVRLAKRSSLSRQLSLQAQQSCTAKAKMLSLRPWTEPIRDIRGEGMTFIRILSVSVLLNPHFLLNEWINTFKRSYPQLLWRSSK